ncbi:uncharacterized protein LOC127851579 [Dreissena polymorpha]|uniref:uncharacterized protein LOC127851579 n=1 Tax=Dreissena polymorpha TaxID=45954 RepID=UPI002264B08E|nr:uncharacterized protein LOC127851579 [Dreissena polymorpha]
MGYMARTFLMIRLFIKQTPREEARIMEHILHVLLVISLASATLKFEVHECQTTAEPVLRLHNFSISNETIVIPVLETIEVDVQFLKPIDVGHTIDFVLQNAYITAGFKRHACTAMDHALFLSMLMLLGGDVETTPGPPRSQKQRT